METATAACRRGSRCRGLPGWAVASLLGLLLLGCSETRPVNGLQFARVWQDSYGDAAISWWYVGEDGEYFHLEQRGPDDEVRYLVPKSFIVLNGIDGTGDDEPAAPVRVTRDNLEFM
jgi:hypothetical protein